MHTYWIVQGNSATNHRFNTEVEARMYAEKMAKKNAGHRYTLLVSLASVKKSEITWEDTREQLPF